MCLQYLSWTMGYQKHDAAAVDRGQQPHCPNSQHFTRRLKVHGGRKVDYSIWLFDCDLNLGADSEMLGADRARSYVCLASFFFYSATTRLLYYYLFGRHGGALEEEEDVAAACTGESRAEQKQGVPS